MFLCCLCVGKQIESLHLKSSCALAFKSHYGLGYTPSVHAIDIFMDSVTVVCRARPPLSDSGADPEIVVEFDDDGRTLKLLPPADSDEATCGQKIDASRRTTFTPRRMTKKRWAHNGADLIISWSFFLPCCRGSRIVRAKCNPIWPIGFFATALLLRIVALTSPPSLVVKQKRELHGEHL